jgi:hypothetical protein
MTNNIFEYEIIEKNDDYMLEKLKNIISNNIYVNKCISNSKKDIHSLSYLFHDLNLSQSDNIKVGNGLEKILCQFISESTKLKNIKNKNTKGVKEKDHLFLHEEDKIIYYAELKSNLNLDTEKSKYTENKCSQIEKELQNKYPEYKIIMRLVCLRYCNKKDIPKIITNKYKDIQEKLIGLNDYFTLLNINLKFNNKNEYKNILNFLIKKMFNK